MKRACECCDRFAPQPHDGSKKKGPCKGTEAIDEARAWAKKFRTRALKSEAEVKEIREALAIEKGLNAHPATGEPERHKLTLTEFMDISEEILFSGEVQGKPFSEYVEKFKARADRIISGPSVSISKDPRDFSTHGDPCCKPGECKQGHRDVFSCLDWQQNRDLVYCSGKLKHHFLKDSPMHEQMLERGCFKCGAFPESEAPTCAHDACNNQLLKVRNYAPYCSMLCKVNSR